MNFKWIKKIFWGGDSSRGRIKIFNKTGITDWRKFKESFGLCI